MKATRRYSARGFWEINRQLLIKVVAFGFCIVMVFFASAAQSQQQSQTIRQNALSCQYYQENPPCETAALPSGSIYVDSITATNDSFYNRTVTYYCPAAPSGLEFSGATKGGELSGYPGVEGYVDCLYTPPVCADPFVEHPDGSCACPVGTQFVNGECIVPPGIDNCVVAIQNSGGNGRVSVSESGQVSCSIGDFTGSCSGTFVNEACYSQPTGDDGDECSGGAAYGTFNGTPVCVGSVPVDQTGTSDPDSWGESTSDAQVVSEETEVSQTTDSNGDPVTSTSTTATTETTTTETKPNEEAAPFVCDDGRLAVDRPSCDSATVCESGYYLVYGSCVPLPAESSSETTQETTTTTTTTNQNTGEEKTETTTSNTTRPGSGGGTIKVEIEGLDGPCDPSQPGYLECAAGEGKAMPGHTDNQGKGLQDGFEDVYNRMKASPVATAMQSVANIVPDGPGACQAFSIDLSDTVIGINESTTVHCDIAESIRGVLGTVMMVFWTICAFRIFASA